MPASALARHDAFVPARRHSPARSPRRLAVVPDPLPPAPVDDGAVVVRLFAPEERDSAAPLRLTRRGVGVVVLALTILSAAILTVAARSAPAPHRTAGPARVAVQPGDTLWAVALRVAPDTDPRAEVATLRRLNGIDGVVLHPGEILRTR